MKLMTDRTYNARIEEAIQYGVEKALAEVEPAFKHLEEMVTDRIQEVVDNFHDDVKIEADHGLEVQLDDGSGPGCPMITKTARDIHYRLPTFYFRFKVFPNSTITVHRTFPGFNEGGCAVED